MSRWDFDRRPQLGADAPTFEAPAAGVSHAAPRLNTRGEVYINSEGQTVRVLPMVIRRRVSLDNVRLSGTVAGDVMGARPVVRKGQQNRP